MELRPIGVVRSPFDRTTMPPLGAPAAVEVFEEFAEGLLHLEKHTHLWVLAWLDSANRDALQVTPRGCRGEGDKHLHGVFALRSPARPNPIGLSVARITGRDGLRIEVDRLDFADGTPVIDLKPYFVTRDVIFSATNAQIGRPASREALRNSLLMQAMQFHGEICPDLERAVDLLTEFRAAVLNFVDPAEIEITAPLSRPHLIDALMGMTRATPGSGSLRFGTEDQVVIVHGGTPYSYRLA